MSKIEEVAEQLWSQWTGQSDFHIDTYDHGEDERNEWRVMARAALLAIREPDEGMLRAGIKAESHRSMGSLKVNHIWSAMIQAALTQENGE